MTKKKILLGSILKPVNDARMYEKFGISISKNNGYEVHIAGYKSIVPENGNIQFHSLFSFKRLSFSRFLAPWKFYNLLLKLKPQLVIVTTPELLMVTCTYKILFGTVILYDVQENYFRNLLFTQNIATGFNYILAYIIRNIEYLTLPLISRYFLAEKSYVKELNFIRNNYNILENRYKPNDDFSLLKKGVVNPYHSSNRKIKLLYSGTIAEVFGIFKAIELCKKLHQIDSSFELTIIGYASQKQCLTNVLNSISCFPFIKLIGGDELVPHPLIIKEIQKADFGIVSYLPNKSTKNKMPTKIFEYLAQQLPMIIQNNAYWEERTKPYMGALFIDFDSINVLSLIEDLHKFNFYPNGIDKEILWEENILLSEIDKALNKDNI